MFDDEDHLADEVVEYITLAHSNGRTVTVGALACDFNSPLWRCGAVKPMVKFVNRHLDKLALAVTGLGRNHNGGLEVLVVSSYRYLLQLVYTSEIAKSN